MSNKKVYGVFEEYFVEAAGSDNITEHKNQLVGMGVYETKDLALKIAKKHFNKKVSDETNKFTEFFKVDPKAYINSFEDDGEYGIEITAPAWSRGFGGETQTWTYYVMQLDVVEQVDI